MGNVQAVINKMIINFNELPKTVSGRQRLCLSEIRVFGNKGRDNRLGVSPDPPLQLILTSRLIFRDY
jgi:hypothetical protein